MRLLRNRVFISIGFLLCSAGILWSEEELLDFAFVGRVEDVDLALQPLLKKDHVFSGTLRFKDEFIEQEQSIGDGFVNYINIVDSSEFTLDEFYVLQGEGQLARGDSLAEVVNAEPDSGVSDYMRLLIPVKPSERTLGGFQVAWMELFFWDEQGVMFSDESLPKRAIEFQIGSFRLSYFDKEKQIFAYVIGTLEQYYPLLNDPSRTDERSRLEAIILELNQVLVEQRNTIERLESELKRAKSEIAELRAELKNRSSNNADEALVAQKSRNRELELEVKTLQSKLDIHEERKVEAERSLKNMADQTQRLQTQQGELLQALQEANAALSQEKTKLKALSATGEQYKEEIKAHKLLIENLRKKMNEASYPPATVVFAVEDEAEAETRVVETVKPEVISVKKPAKRKDADTGSRIFRGPRHRRR